MMLREEFRRRLLRDRGIYVTEACDMCGQLLGPARYTRRGELGVWCSRDCRDGAEAHAPGTCKTCGAKLADGRRRGAMYCDDACKLAAHRSKTDVQTSRTAKLSVTKPSIYAAFSPEKSGDGLAGQADQI